MLVQLFIAFLIQLSSAQLSSSVDVTDPNLSACAPAFDAISSCISKTVSFTSLSAHDKASCLCYPSATAWDPKAFDVPWSACIAYAKTGDVSDYPAALSQAGLCSSVGNILSSPTAGIAVTTKATALSTSSGKGSTSTPTSTGVKPTTSTNGGAGLLKKGNVWDLACVVSGQNSVLFPLIDRCVF